MWITSVPIGTICAYAGPVAPTGKPAVLLEAQGWTLCDGRELEVARFPELYAVLGDTYGGEPCRTFRIPDCRGLFLRGVDYGAGNDPDASQRTSADGKGQGDGPGSRQDDALQTHTHTYNDWPASSSFMPGGPTAVIPPSKPTETGAPTQPARTSSETRPKNIAVNFIIKYR